jgi:hypothetical protein
VDPPAWWPASSALWRAFDRTSATSGLLGLFIVGFLGITAFSSSDDGAIGVIKLVLAGGFVIAMVLLWTTALWAWPTVLVPYRYRGRPGLADDQDPSPPTVS